MTLRVVESEQGRESLIKLIQERELPMTVTIIKGRGRSLKQNRLQRLWLNEASEQLQEYTAEEYRGYFKLVIGVPIMREEDEVFCAAYDKVIKPLAYELKLLAMQEPLSFPVTSIMTTKQKKRFLDEMYIQLSKLGCNLSDPDMLGLKE